jgi:hypothetical protein
MTKVYGADTPVTAELGLLLPGIGKTLVPIEGAAALGPTPVGINYTVVLFAASFVNQSPVALDTPIQVNFGAPQSNAFIDLDAAGTVAFLQDGLYQIEVRATIGRATNPGNAIFLARSRLNGIQIGNSFHANLPNNQIQTPLFAATTVAASVNDEFTVQVARSSLGNNSGGLFTQSAGPLGWAASPSIQIVVTRITAVTL